MTTELQLCPLCDRPCAGDVCPPCAVLLQPVEDVVGYAAVVSAQPPYVARRAE